MNIELSTTNLRNSCRICLRAGELNVLKHEVKLPKMQTTLTCNAGMHEKVSVQINENGADGDSVKEQEIITLKAIMESFERLEEKSDVTACLEMQLICESCARELLPCYLYYRKLKQANERIKQIYAEALKIEQQQQQEVSDTETGTTSSLEELHELVAISGTNSTQSTPPSSPTRVAAAVSKCKAYRKPKFILTGSVSKMLTNIKNDGQSTLTTPTKRVCSNIAEMRDMQKRARTQETEDDVAMPLKNASLVVTRFIATSNDETKSANNESREINFKAVEIKGEHLHSIMEEEADDWNAIVKSTEAATPVYACKYCPQAFAMPQYFAAHMRKWHVCKFCTHVFDRMNELHEHIRQSHQQHVCAICNKELSSHSNLRGHIKRVHGLKLPADVALLDYWPAAEIVYK